MRDICEIAEQEKKYFIYGTAELGRYCCDKLVDSFGEGKVLGFIESNPRKGRVFRGKKVYTLSEARALANEHTNVIITGLNEFDLMKKNCIDSGFSESCLIVVREMAIFLKKNHGQQVRHVAFYPAIDVYDKHLLDKIAWFLPDRIKVSLCSDCDDVRKHIGDNVMMYAQEEYGNVLECADYILLWDFLRRGDIFEKYQDRVRIVDPNFYMNVDIINFSRLYYASFTEAERADMVAQSRMLFEELKKESEKCDVANIFCTGPSIGEVEEMDAKDFAYGLNIICNSMVKDKKLLKKIHPSVLTYADSGLYISPTEYAMAFYRDVIETYKEHCYYIVVPIWYRALILKHFPMLAKRMIGIPHENRPDYWFPNERFAIKGLSNIFTEYMLPLASALCEKVRVHGCTGRNPDETYFWKHNADTQYLDLMQTIFDMWPSFFYWQKYDEYYDTHCQNIENLMRYGESKGKRYENKTTSFIPALRKRSV